MTIGQFWETLEKYRATPLPIGYPPYVRRLYAPVDQVHEAIKAGCQAASFDLASAMYGWNDRELNELFLEKLEDEHLPVEVSLDSTQAAGPSEVPLIREWAHVPGNSLAIGHAAKGISHLKTIVADGILTIGGSTNLSHSGQYDQNNEAVFILDAVYAAETRARLSVIHDEMLMQMAKHKQKLMVDWAAKKTLLTADERHSLEAGIIPVA